MMQYLFIENICFELTKVVKCFQLLHLKHSRKSQYEVRQLLQNKHRCCLDENIPVYLQHIGKENSQRRNELNLHLIFLQLFLQIS